MIKEQLLQRSPIRILEQSINGGLGKGNLGVFAAKKGVGKTACLVHFAQDKILRGGRVLHISFSDNTHHIESWYNQVFEELSNTYHLENREFLFQDMLKNRLILHLKTSDLKFNFIKSTIDQLYKIPFHPDLVIVDGMPFQSANKMNLEPWKKFAQEHQVEIWFSAALKNDINNKTKTTIPHPISGFKDSFSVIIMLNPKHDYVDLQLLKNHDTTNFEKLKLKLNPQTLLITNHRI